MLGARRILFSGRAVLVVLVCAGLLGWGVMAAVKTDLVLDTSGRDLAEARALVAELAPDTRITLVGTSSLERLILPLARGSDRLRIEHIDPAWTDGEELKNGDIQVRSGDVWLVLNRPDLDTLLWALALVSSPYSPTPLMDPPTERVTVIPAAPAGPVIDRAQVLAWGVSGVLLPVAVGIGGLWWRRRRRGL